jgi:predicted dehydrogenase
MAAERGLPVFCEKPLATSLAGAREMAATVAAAGITNQVGLVLRSSPAFLALKALIEDPASGRVMSVVFRDDQFIPTQGSYRSSWRGDVLKAGAGTLVEHSIHDVDMLEWVIGPMASVSAMTAGFHGIEGIEDVAGVAIRFANGAIGSLMSVWHDVLDRPSLRRTEVFCERAWFCVERDWLGPLTYTRADGTGGVIEGDALFALAPSPDGAHSGQGNPDGAFVRAAAEGRPATPDFAVAVRAHELVDAMYRSAAEGGIPQPVGP